VKYRLVYTRRAGRDIKKLEPNIKERIGKALLRYSEEPFRFAEKLSDSIEIMPSRHHLITY
jgi:mRNA interferase RelE/StbE